MQELLKSPALGLTELGAYLSTQRFRATKKEDRAAVSSAVLTKTTVSRVKPTQSVLTDLERS